MSNLIRGMMISLFFMILVGFIGCTDNSTIGCTVEDLMITTTSNSIANGLNCQAPEAIKEDISAIVKKMNLCKSGQQGLGSEVCKIASGLIIDSIVTVGIPSKWKCDPKATVETLKTVINSGCDLIP